MALEDVINENTAVMRELVVELKAKRGETPVVDASNGEAAAAKRGPGRPAKAQTPAVTIDMVKAAGAKVLEVKGKPAALSLVKAHGADRIADMDPSRYAQFIAAADVLLAEKADEPAADDDEI